MPAPRTADLIRLLPRSGVWPLPRPRLVMEAVRPEDKMASWMPAKRSAGVVRRPLIVLI